MKFSVRIYANTINSDIIFDTMERFIDIINYKIKSIFSFTTSMMILELFIPVLL